jgi:hypothetical protein
MASSCGRGRRVSTLVKYWSTAGQTLIKYWSTAGETLVKYRPTAGQASR